MKKAILTLAALCATTLFGADVTGKWNAEFTGRNGEKRTMTFNLKADGDKLSGTVSSPRGESEILDGKIDGDDISFSVKTEIQGESRTIPYSGKVAGDELKLKMGTGERTREITAKRATS